MIAEHKVSFVVPAYAPAFHYGGPVQKLHLLTKALSRLGCKVSIVAGDYGVREQHVPPGRRTIDGVSVIHTKVYARYRWTPLLCGLKLSDAIGDASVVHIIGYRDCLTYSAARVAQSNGTPYVVEPVGMWHRGSRKRLLKGAVDRLSSRYFRNAAALIATSPQEAVSIAHLNSRVVLRPNPVPVGAERATREPSNTVTAVWIGRLAASKGLPVLLRAMAAVPKLQLVLAGPDDGDGTAECVHNMLLANPALANRVSLLGPLYGAEKAHLLSQADFFVLPSPRESFGNAAGEAIAHGVPALVTTGAGIASLISRHRAGIVCEPTVQGIADGLNRMVRSLSGPDPFADGVVSMARDLSPDSVARRQLEIYRELS